MIVELFEYLPVKEILSIIKYSSDDNEMMIFKIFRQLLKYPDDDPNYNVSTKSVPEHSLNVLKIKQLRDIIIKKNDLPDTLSKMMIEYSYSLDKYSDKDKPFNIENAGGTSYPIVDGKISFDKSKTITIYDVDNLERFKWLFRLLRNKYKDLIREKIIIIDIQMDYLKLIFLSDNLQTKSKIRMIGEKMDKATETAEGFLTEETIRVKYQKIMDKRDEYLKSLVSYYY